MPCASPDYRLETASQACVLGRGKLIDSDAHRTRERKSNVSTAKSPRRSWRYNLEDSQPGDRHPRTEGLLDLAIERSLLSGMQLDRVGREHRVVRPRLPARAATPRHRRTERGRAIARAAPVSGGRAPRFTARHLLKNVAVFDFKSLYPSLIRTFNLDPLAHAERQGHRTPSSRPQTARASRATGAILPGIIERFMKTPRGRASERGDRHADQAIKIMMNAMYGVLGAVGLSLLRAPKYPTRSPVSGSRPSRGPGRRPSKQEGVHVSSTATPTRSSCGSKSRGLDSDGSTSEARAEGTARRACSSDWLCDRHAHRATASSPSCFWSSSSNASTTVFFLPRLRAGARAEARSATPAGPHGKLDIVGLEVGPAGLACDREAPTRADCSPDSSATKIALPFVKPSSRAALQVPASSTTSSST